MASMQSASSDRSRSASRGPVSSGDYIVASGSNDGIGVAISPADVSLNHLDRLVGRAWESSYTSGVKRVNTVVGLDRSEILRQIIGRQQTELDRQRADIEELRQIVAGLMNG